MFAFVIFIFLPLIIALLSNVKVESDKVRTYFGKASLWMSSEERALYDAIVRMDIRAIKDAVKGAEKDNPFVIVRPKYHLVHETFGDGLKCPRFHIHTGTSIRHIEEILRVIESHKGFMILRLDKALDKRWYMPNPSMRERIVRKALNRKALNVTAMVAFMILSTFVGGEVSAAPVEGAVVVGDLETAPVEGAAETTPTERGNMDFKTFYFLTGGLAATIVAIIGGKKGWKESEISNLQLALIWFWPLVAIVCLFRKVRKTMITVLMACFFAFIGGDLAAKEVDVKAIHHSVEAIAMKDGNEILPLFEDAVLQNVRLECRDELLPILVAIRYAENGRPGIEFGVLHPKAINTDWRTQCGWAAATVQKNWDRWKKRGSPGKFIEFLGAKYCPVGAKNDPDNLNAHWVTNVTYWSEKIKRGLNGPASAKADVVSCKDGDLWPTNGQNLPLKATLEGGPMEWVAIGILMSLIWGLIGLVAEQFVKPVKFFLTTVKESFAAAWTSFSNIVKGIAKTIVSAIDFVKYLLFLVEEGSKNLFRKRGRLMKKFMTAAIIAVLGIFFPVSGACMMAPVVAIEDHIPVVINRKNRKKLRRMFGRRGPILLSMAGYRCLDQALTLSIGANKANLLYKQFSRYLRKVRKNKRTSRRPLWWPPEQPPGSLEPDEDGIIRWVNRDGQMVWTDTDSEEYRRHRNLSDARHIDTDGCIREVSESGTCFSLILIGVILVAIGMVSMLPADIADASGMAIGGLSFRKDHGFDAVKISLTLQSKESEEAIAYYDLKINDPEVMDVLGEWIADHNKNKGVEYEFVVTPGPKTSETDAKRLLSWNNSGMAQYLASQRQFSLIVDKSFAKSIGIEKPAMEFKISTPSEREGIPHQGNLVEDLLSYFGDEYEIDLPTSTNDSWVYAITVREKTLGNRMEDAGFELLDTKKVRKRVSTLCAVHDMSGKIDESQIFIDEDMTPYDGFLKGTIAGLTPGKIYFLQYRAYVKGKMIKGFGVFTGGDETRIVTGSENVKKGLGKAEGIWFTVALIGDAESQEAGTSRGFRRTVMLPMLILSQQKNAWFEKFRGWLNLALKKSAKFSAENRLRTVEAVGAQTADSHRDNAALSMREIGALTTVITAMVKPFEEMIKTSFNYLITGADKSLTDQSKFDGLAPKSKQKLVSKNKNAGYNLKQTGIYLNGFSGPMVPMGVLFDFLEEHALLAEFERQVEEVLEKRAKKKGYSIKDVRVKNGCIEYKLKKSANKVQAHGLHLVESRLISMLPKGAILVSDGFAIKTDLKTKIKQCLSFIMGILGGADLDGDGIVGTRSNSRGKKVSGVLCPAKGGQLKYGKAENPMLIWRNPVGPGEWVYISQAACLVSLPQNDLSELPILDGKEFEVIEFDEAECLKQDFTGKKWSQETTNDYLDVKYSMDVFLGMLIDFNMKSFIECEDGMKAPVFPSEATVDALQQELASKDFFAWAKKKLKEHGHAGKIGIHLFLRFYKATEKNIERISFNKEAITWFEDFAKVRDAEYLEAREYLKGTLLTEKGKFTRRYLSTRKFAELIGDDKLFDLLERDMEQFEFPAKNASEKQMADARDSVAACFGFSTRYVRKTKDKKTGEITPSHNEVYFDIDNVDPDYLDIVKRDLPGDHSESQKQYANAFWMLMICFAIMGKRIYEEDLGYKNGPIAILCGDIKPLNMLPSEPDGSISHNHHYILVLRVLRGLGRFEPENINEKLLKDIVGYDGSSHDEYEEVQERPDADDYDDYQASPDDYEDYQASPDDYEPPVDDDNDEDEEPPVDDDNGDDGDDDGDDDDDPPTPPTTDPDNDDDDDDDVVVVVSMRGDRNIVERLRSEGHHAVYIGRSMPNLEGSALGNPYRGESKEENIENYREWFLNQMKGTNRVSEAAWKLMHGYYQALKNGKKVFLVCWCAPEGCHGDVLKEWLISKKHWFVNKKKGGNMEQESDDSWMILDQSDLEESNDDWMILDQSDLEESDEDWMILEQESEDKTGTGTELEPDWSAEPVEEPAVKPTVKAGNNSILDFASEYIEKVQPPLGQGQKDAILGVLNDLYLEGLETVIVNGEPGTGKTTVAGHIAKILQEYFSENGQLAMRAGAFTSAAARRLQKSLDDQDLEIVSTTIHKFLGNRIFKTYDCLPDREFTEKAIKMFPNPEDPDLLKPHPLDEYGNGLLRVAKKVKNWSKPEKWLIIIDEASMVSPHIWRMLLDRASMRKDVQFLLLGDMKQLEPVLQTREDFYFGAVKRKRVAKLAQQAGFQVDVDDPESTADEMIAYMESVSLYDTLYGDGELLEGDTTSPLAIPSIPKYRLTENFRQSKESDNSILEYLEVLERFAQTGKMEPRGHWGQDVSRAVQEFFSTPRQQFEWCDEKTAVAAVVANPGDSFFINPTNADNNRINSKCWHEVSHLEDSRAILNVPTFGAESTKSLDYLVSQGESILSPGHLILVQKNCISDINNTSNSIEVLNGDRIKVISSEMALLKDVANSKINHHKLFVVGIHGEVLETGRKVVLFARVSIKDKAVSLEPLEPHYLEDKNTPNPASAFCFEGDNGTVDLLSVRKPHLVTDKGFDRLVSLVVEAKKSWLETKNAKELASELDKQYKSMLPEKFYSSYISTESTECELGWSVTAHKAQGSEYQTVYTSEDVIMGTRFESDKSKQKHCALKLCYTLVSRAKVKVVVVKKDVAHSRRLPM